MRQRISNAQKEKIDACSKSALADKDQSDSQDPQDSQDYYACQDSNNSIYSASIQVSFSCINCLYDGSGCSCGNFRQQAQQTSKSQSLSLKILLSTKHLMGIAHKSQVMLPQSFPSSSSCPIGHYLLLQGGGLQLVQNLSLHMRHPLVQYCCRQMQQVAPPSSFSSLWPLLQRQLALQRNSYLISFESCLHWLPCLSNSWGLWSMALHCWLRQKNCTSLRGRYTPLSPSPQKLHSRYLNILKQSLQYCLWHRDEHIRSQQLTS